MYAIVDIETTGGHASSNGITEIAIIQHDGIAETGRFETLVNPQQPIPIYIRALTGITEELVTSAPVFEDLAPTIFELLNGKIFIAHNVNFDYSFLKYHLSKYGFDLNCKKVCTVRLGRKVFPGLPSYSLGKFCNAMGVSIQNRHRALGDADATSRLFSMMLKEDKENYLHQFLNARSKEQILPPNLAKEKILSLPDEPGVYYFHNEKGKVIYVGKAKSLKRRVVSHFSNNSTGKRKQDFLREIYDISFEVCGSELMAFILEAIEIKRIWPRHNQSLKRFEQVYGLFSFEDQRGYLRLAIDKRSRFSVPLYTFNLLTKGYNLLRSLVNQYQLCPKLCYLQATAEACSHPACRGACRREEDVFNYNSRVYEALNELKVNMPSFAISDRGRAENEKGWILMERGRFYGMGYLSDSVSISIQCADDLKPYLTPYSSNEYIKNMILNYASKFPERKIEFKI